MRDYLLQHKHFQLIAWRQKRNYPRWLEEMPAPKLSNARRRFYVGARNIKESHTAEIQWECSIRSGLDRYLSGLPQRKSFSIIRDKEFKPANKAFDAVLKDIAQQGLTSWTKHKWPISQEDNQPIRCGKSRKFS